MQDYDIIIAGAGPAGCAAARTLALKGWRVGLFDKANFPREKVCGDALIPDAHLALDKLGLRERVGQISFPISALRIISFDGSEAVVRGKAAVVPRIRLDYLLLEAAQEAGARFLPGHEFRSLIRESTRYRVEFESEEGVAAQSANWVLLATGANVAPLARAGLLERRQPSGFAVRQYVRNPRLAREIRELVFIFDHTVRGGYGWIFPGPDGVFNTGISLFGNPRKHGGLRRSYEQFISRQPLTKELMSGGEIVSPLKGAPLRTGLAGARFADGGLLAAGECVGTTLSLTGEGVGKALETGLLAAEVLLAHAGQGRAAVATAYNAGMSALKPKYNAYRKAELLLRRPWLANILVRRAGRGGYVHTRLEALFNEAADPANLFSLSTWVRILLR